MPFSNFSYDSSHTREPEPHADFNLNRWEGILTKKSVRVLVKKDEIDVQIITRSLFSRMMSPVMSYLGDKWNWAYGKEYAEKHIELAHQEKEKFQKTDLGSQGLLSDSSIKEVQEILNNQDYSNLKIDNIFDSIIGSKTVGVKQSSEVAPETLINTIKKLIAQKLPTETPQSIPSTSTSAPISPHSVTVIDLQSLDSAGLRPEPSLPQSSTPLASDAVEGQFSTDLPAPESSPAAQRDVSSLPPSVAEPESVERAAVEEADRSLSQGIQQQNLQQTLEPKDLQPVLQSIEVEVPGLGARDADSGEVTQSLPPTAPQPIEAGTAERVEDGESLPSQTILIPQTSISGAQPTQTVSDKPTDLEKEIESPHTSSTSADISGGPSTPSSPTSVAASASSVSTSYSEATPELSGQQTAAAASSSPTSATSVASPTVSTSYSEPTPEPSDQQTASPIVAPPVKEIPKKQRVERGARRISLCAKITGLFAVGAFVWWGSRLGIAGSGSHIVAKWGEGSSQEGTLAFDFGNKFSAAPAASQYVVPETDLQKLMRFALGAVEKLSPSQSHDVRCRYSREQMPRVIGSSEKANRENAPYLYDETITDAQGKPIKLTKGDLFIPMYLRPSGEQQEAGDSSPGTIYLPYEFIQASGDNINIRYNGLPLTLHPEPSEGVSWQAHLDSARVEEFVSQGGRDTRPMTRAEGEAFLAGLSGSSSSSYSSPTDWTESYRIPRDIQERLIADGEELGGMTMSERDFQKTFKEDTPGVKRSMKVVKEEVEDGEDRFVVGSPADYIGIDEELDNYQQVTNPVAQADAGNNVLIGFPATGTIENIHIALTDEGVLGLQVTTAPPARFAGLSIPGFGSRSYYLATDISSYANVSAIQEALRNNPSAVEIIIEAGELLVRFIGAARTPPAPS